MTWHVIITFSRFRQHTFSLSLLCCQLMLTWSMKARGAGPRRRPSFLPHVLAVFAGAQQFKVVNDEMKEKSRKPWWEDLVLPVNGCFQGQAGSNKELYLQHLGWGFSSWREQGWEDDTIALRAGRFKPVQNWKWMISLGLVLIHPSDMAPCRALF